MNEKSLWELQSQIDGLLGRVFSLEATLSSAVAEIAQLKDMIQGPIQIDSEKISAGTVKRFLDGTARLDADLGITEEGVWMKAPQIKLEEEK